MLLLDTCALLWLSQGGGQLSPEVCTQINDAPAVFVSAVSGFEISLKHQKGKLVLPLAPGEWFDKIIKHHDLKILPLDLAICIRSTTLPTIHMDPCDRFIIATAEILKIPVVTADRVFQQYDITVIK